MWNTSWRTNATSETPFDRILYLLFELVAFAGHSAGGCRNNLAMFATNPQYLLTVFDDDVGGGGGSDSSSSSDEDGGGRRGAAAGQCCQMANFEP